MTHGYRIKGKHKRLVPADSATPHNCVILAVDPATTSGWCVTVAGHYRFSGETKMESSGDRLVNAERIAQVVELALNLPCVLLLEKPFARNPETVATLYAVRRQWKALWKAWAKGHAGKMVDVAVPTWRSKVLGATTGDSLPDLERRVAVYFAGDRLGGPDENAAICIAKWGSTAGEVAKVIPKRFWGA